MSHVMPATAPDQPSLIEQSLLGAVALGLVAMLSLPATRSTNETLGWLPFWLLALPLSAWVVARLLRLREQRTLAAARRPMASVHALHDVRPRTVVVRDLRRAA
ncbi:hypothetical protein [Lysobacter brunescens]|uniref:Transmembrane protein n=1 Tax=Lysobacter brunescens TaxID=262323 RepID=A0ABW2Y8H7_9GAMM